MMRDISDKQSLMELIDELQDLVDDKRERVAKLFADIRASVPRPMTLVFTETPGGEHLCETAIGECRYWQNDEGTWCGCFDQWGYFYSLSEEGIVMQLVDTFDWKWSEMTAKGAVT